MAKILIIDDEKVICEAFQEILQEEGHEVDTAQNGLDGLQKVQDKEFDLIFLDVLMPRMEGREVFDRIRKIKNVPVAIMSGFIPPHKEKEVLALGAVACLKKPLDITQIKKVIKDVKG